MNFTIELNFKNDKKNREILLLFYPIIAYVAINKCFLKICSLRGIHYIFISIISNCEEWEKRSFSPSKSFFV